MKVGDERNFVSSLFQSLRLNFLLSPGSSWEISMWRLEAAQLAGVYIHRHAQRPTIQLWLPLLSETRRSHLIGFLFPAIYICSGYVWLWLSMCTSIANSTEIGGIFEPMEGTVYSYSKWPIISFCLTVGDCLTSNDLHLRKVGSKLSDISDM